MRVLHIITGLDAGGAEQQLRLLLRRLPVRCDVISLTGPGTVGPGIRADGTPVTALHAAGPRDLGALPGLVRLIRAGGYDLVHTHLFRACVLGRTAARLAGVRAIIATEHSLGGTRPEGHPRTLRARAAYLASERLGSATVAVSATVADRLRAWGVPSGRVHLIPYGIDAGHFRFDPGLRAAARKRLGLAERDFVIGAVGRLTPGRRHDLLLRALAEVPGARLLLVGDGPERNRLHTLAYALDLAERVRLLGERDGVVETAGDRPADIPGLLAAMDVFVSPSPGEAFGLAVLEALAAGLPVLHAGCPAVDELPPEAAPGARRIAPDITRLAAVLREHALGVPRRLPPPAAVERYAVDRTAQRLMALYDRTAGHGTDGCARGPAPTAGHHDFPALLDPRR